MCRLTDCCRLNKVRHHIIVAAAVQVAVIETRVEAAVVDAITMIGSKSSFFFKKCQSLIYQQTALLVTRLVIGRVHLLGLHIAMVLHDVVPVLDTVVEDTVVDRHLIEDAHDRVIEVPKDVAGVLNVASKCQSLSIILFYHSL